MANFQIPQGTHRSFLETRVVSLSLLCSIVLISKVSMVRIPSWLVQLDSFASLSLVIVIFLPLGETKSI